MSRELSFVRLGTAALFAVVAFVSSLSFAAEWEIDSAHSAAHFKVKHLLVSKVHGQFGDVKGKLTIDDKDSSKLTAEATIGVASVDTQDAKRDEHLKGADFFDVTKFPTMTFKSTKVTKNGKKLKLIGDLTMHGVTKAVTLDAEVAAPVKDFAGNPRRGLSATTTINRKDFGITWNKVLDGGAIAVGDEVNVEIDLELMTPSKPAAETKPKQG